LSKLQGNQTVNMTDDAILQGCLRNDTTAQRELYNRYSPKMLSVCYRFAHHREDAEDMLQEGFIKVFSQIHTFQSKGAFEGWVRRIIVHTCINHLKKNKKFKMIRVARTIERVANTNVSVMLLGASGTGKELLARGLHEASGRASGAFVAINCAAIPENLLESELFGHEKGAFTGAVKTVQGKIEQAAGGTLFLDEVGDIPLQLQVKLLRFLQERVIERVGSRESIPVDTRIVCATHQDLEAMIGDGRFREDLFYRLAEIVVKIPSLSERPGDAALLAKVFLSRYSKEMNPRVRGFAADALAAIDAWGWPGNVRELENRVKRAVIMADEKLVSAADLDLLEPDEQEVNALNLKSAREQSDRKVIRHALARSEGNISSTAKMLGISRPTLYDLLKHYDLHA